MDGFTFNLALGFLFGTAALGIYLLLPTPHPLSKSAAQWFGSMFALVSLGLLGVLLLPRIDWWQEPSEQRWMTTAAFYVLSAACLISAVRTITAPHFASGSLWFAVTWLAVSGLLFLLGAPWAATVFLIPSAGVATLRITKAKKMRRTDAAELANPRLPGTSSSACHEPFLACATGALFSVILVGTIHYALASGSVSNLEDRVADVAQRQLEAIRAYRGDDASPAEPALNGSVTQTGALLLDRHLPSLAVAATLLLTAFIAAGMIVGTRAQQTSASSAEPKSSQHAAGADSTPVQPCPPQAPNGETGRV